MMFKCQKCGFENQMGSIFCRECGEKLDMNAIDPNKLQKDVDKEKLIKKTKKRIKSAISACIGLLILAAFLGVIFYNGGLREYEEPTVNAASVNQKYNSAVRGGNGGQTKFSYDEINALLKSKVVEPLSEIDSFVKVTAAEVTFDAEKEEPVIYLWLSIKDKVPVIYTVHGDFSLIKAAEGDDDEPAMPVELNVKRLDIGRLPIFYRSDIFLDGFNPLLNNDTVVDFFRRAQEVMFTADGMTVNMSKNVPAASNSPAPSAASAASPLRSTTDPAKAEAARQAAEEKRQKQEEAKQKAEEAKREREEKARQLAEERKQKQEEAKQKAEEAKREREEKQRQLEEERRQRVEDARREREERRRERERDRNNGYGSSSRNRSSRNRY